ncbi:MAG: chorismate synthase [Oscillospiraceae bacterium]|nr:chorismate synthase [Oscillospiraceae bacterium]
MSSTWIGNTLRLSLFGQSHSAAVGMTLDGLPAGLAVDAERLQAFLNRRAPGRNAWSTARREEDVPEFLCGLKDGFTCGAPLTAIIRNNNTRSQDYVNLKTLPRPGHADYAANLRYQGFQDASGGGHFSGRLTAPLCVAGGILLQELQRRGVSVMARIVQIGSVRDDSAFSGSVSEKTFPASDDEADARMQEAILRAKEEGDSLGGIIECVITGFPGGLGSPIFDGIESRLAQMLFAIPAVKGIEFGAGFRAASLKGSENNDPFCVNAEGKIATVSNNAGGLLGGISIGTPIVFRLAVKPTPSIAKAQQSVNLETLQPETLRIQGRHDPCIVPRAVPVAEAAAALVLFDLLLEG